MICSKGPKGGIEPVAAAARTQPLYMGHLLYTELSAPPHVPFLISIMTINMFMHPQR